MIKRNLKGQFVKGSEPLCPFKKGHISLYKGIHIRLNTGRTHFQKGMTPWNKGEEWDKEIRKIMSESRKGKHYSFKTEFKKGMTSWCKNKKNLKITGKNNHNWKGGVSSENIKIRKGLKFKLWRKAVFIRDDYICQKCKTKGNKLHPHHIFNFAQFINFRFELFNGITLCEKCHNAFHKKYGRINNNEEQIRNFLALKIARSN